MREITVTADNFYSSYPDSISIVRNRDGTYNLYALLRGKYEENGTEKRFLTSLKSEGLHWKHDFNVEIVMCESREDVYASNARDVKLISIPQVLHNEILYNLQFRKDNGTLVEFEILNEGDGKLNYNIYEGLEEYIVQLNVAGFFKDEISVVLDSGIIKVRVKPISAAIPDDFLCLTESFGRDESECEIYLPNIESVQANLSDGILCLTIPKKQKAERIEIGDGE